MGQETIASDRPGIGSGATVVAHGTVQLETGFEVAHADATGQLTVGLGQAFLRLGVRGVELEVMSSYALTLDSPPPEVDESGLLDVTFGVKLPVGESDGGGARLSLQALVTTPTGADAFSAGDYVPADVLSLIITPGVSLTDRFGIFGGVANAFDGAPDGHVHVMEGGATHLITPNAQLDVNGGWDVDRDDWFLGAGLAVRWPPD